MLLGRALCGCETSITCRNEGQGERVSQRLGEKEGDEKPGKPFVLLRQSTK
eukprot:COSAG05_NODE_1169_length_5605_cov_2.698987_2_plen_51_part_00